MSDKIPVVEVYGPVIQGEGALCGQVSFFLRTFGCGFRCIWCDSLHAVLPERKHETSESLMPTEVVDRVLSVSGTPAKGTWITITGGDPVMWDLQWVVDTLRDQGFRVAVETQGALWRDWLYSADLVTVSPKPPSSGMAEKLNIPMLQTYGVRLEDRMVLKFVAFDEDDLDWAARYRRVLPGARVFLSSGTPGNGGASATAEAVLEGYRWLVGRVLARPELQDATVLPQLHAMIWPGELGR